MDIVIVMETQLYCMKPIASVADGSSKSVRTYVHVAREVKGYMHRTTGFGNL